MTGVVTREAGRQPDRVAPGGTVLLGGLAVPADDGTLLATDVVLPAAGTPAPVVLLRTPYGRAANLAEAHGWARRGFAVAVQDVRGRYDSAGDWLPYRSEGSDGAAALRWLHDQPWCDGRLVVYGGSYAAHCALEAAAAAPHLVSAVIVAVPALGLADTARDLQGVPKLYSHAWWWSSHADARTSRGELFDLRHRADPGLLAHQPLTDLPRRIGVEMPGWLDAWRAQPDHSRRERYATLTSPLLCVAGLYDPFCDSAIDLWRQWGSATPAGTSTSQLLLGPWQHDLGLIHRDRNGARPLAAEHRVDIGHVTTTWLRAALDGQLPAGRRAVLAVDTTHHWLHCARWPAVEQTTPIVLLTGEQPSITFVADPARPFASVAGPDSMPRSEQAVPDCAVLYTEPLSLPLTLVGRACVQLQVSSDAPARHWVARLSEQPSHGPAIQLAHGIVDVGPAATTPTPTQMPMQIDIDLPTVSHQLAAGTRLRVEIAGHHFPLHPRDPHTGADPLLATTGRSATRTVHAATVHLPALPPQSAGTAATNDPLAALLGPNTPATGAHS